MINNLNWSLFIKYRPELYRVVSILEVIGSAIACFRVMLRIIIISFQLKFEGDFMNLPSFIVAAIIAAIIIAIIVTGIRNKKKGKSSCSCGGSCGTCPMSGSCHKSE